MKVNAEMRVFFDECKIRLPMDPREAFYGGRTNAAWLYYRCNRGEKIQYIDIVSLYPWVCKYGKFPIGHPEIVTENFLPVSVIERPYEGLIKLEVVPPRGLLHPVLPLRANGKLLFPLCRTCAQLKQQTRCTHTDEERAITGCWVTDELYKALELGYMIKEIHGVWHYKKFETFDPKSKTGGLFAEYINKFLKLKQQADVWPSWVKTEEDKEKYVKEYEEHEGIRLDPTKIERNSGMRALAKLMLNSFW
jgi:hypothetical protein